MRLAGKNERDENECCYYQTRLYCMLSEREHADFSGDSTLLAHKEMRFPYRPLGAYQKALPNQV